MSLALAMMTPSVSLPVHRIRRRRPRALTTPHSRKRKPPPSLVGGGPLHRTPPAPRRRTLVELFRALRAPRARKVPYAIVAAKGIGIALLVLGIAAFGDLFNPPAHAADAVAVHSETV